MGFYPQYLTASHARHTYNYSVYLRVKIILMCIMKRSESYYIIMIDCFKMK